MEGKNKPLGMVVGQMMKSVMCVLKSRVSGRHDLNLTFDQFGLLHAIRVKEEDVIQKEMAEFMGKDKSSVLKMIDLLESKELVRRVVDMNDRRKNKLLVTKKGEQAIKEGMMLEDEVKKELFVGLTEEEIRTFYKVIDHIKTRAEQIV